MHPQAQPLNLFCLVPKSTSKARASPPRWLLTVIVTFCLGFIPTAHAEWTLYGDNGKAEFYYDKDSVTVDNDQAQVWEMLNYSFPLNRVLSNHSHKVFDCHKRQFRNLMGEFFSAQKLGGVRISSGQDPEENWRVVQEGTRNYDLMALVCPQSF